MDIVDLLLGKPLATEDEQAERIGSVKGIPIFGLDALSSAAYGPEAALTLLIPLGMAGVAYILPITAAIVILLCIVYFSYRQTMQAYPHGGGSYTVASENLGTGAGLLAAAALMIDYVLTAAVGISAGVGALVAAVPSLQKHTLAMCLGILLVLAIVNLRGVRETGGIFMIPTYVFIACLLGMIAALAIGATETLVYVRAEYPLAVERMRRAVADAEREGILGKNVFGTGLPVKCEVMEGAGAFVCGEETAMIASIEGQRGMPRPKPPFPAQSGLWGKPTIINNVETLAHVSRILNVGPEVFRSIGTKDSPGTKTFALTGHVANTGLVEVPFGTTLREIVLNIGGGVTDDAGKIWKTGFKAVQIGGPSGGCLTEEHLDLPLAYESLRSVGAMVGSGGLVAMNQGTCMVSIARFFMEFTQRESCGKCVLCREGTKQLLALLDDVIEGRADAGTIDLLEKLGHAVQAGSLCGLGKTAPNPVLSTLRYFRKEYEEHIFEKRCRTGRCKALLRPEINQVKCKGCGLCIKACPTHAITGEKKKPHHIDPELCIKCGACATACKIHVVEGI